MKRPTLLHRLEHAGFVLARGLLGRLPEGVALAAGETLGWVAGVVLRVRRRVVDENLAGAFPDRSPTWRRRIARESYRHLGREAVATFRASGETAQDVRRRTTVHGLDAFRDAVEAGKGVIAVSGHLGNWEIGGAALAARGLEIDAVVLPQANPLFDRELGGSRSALGLETLPRGDAPRRVLRSLRQGRVVALLADQHARRGGVVVDFMGRPASTPRGPALFALRTGAPLFVGVGLRRPGGGSGHEVWLERVHFRPTGDLEADVRALTQAFTDVLEAWVRRAPEQYFWSHRRWRAPSSGATDRAPGAPAWEPLATGSGGATRAVPRNRPPPPPV